MKISILILTHNRPKLFSRCINSILKNKPSYAEILVNNDSKDISEINGAEYYYENANYISVLYKSLFDKAKGEYIYFLEDDDYVLPNFWKEIEKIDQKCTYVYEYIPLARFSEYSKMFKKDINFEVNFQLSQCVFLKESIHTFPTGNCLQNDYALFLESSSRTDIIYTDTPIFVQTIDGKDNISFPQFNKDSRFVQ